jgi:hypothetical protein
VALTPQQAARQALVAVGPTTRVTVQSNVTVAGEAAYQLVLAPKSPSSLIGQVRIAVDGARDVPLRVQIFARGATSPAFQVGYTSVSFVPPAASNFDFTPPSGAKVSTGKLGSSGHAPSTMRKAEAAPAVVGKDWLAVAVLPATALSGLHGSVSGAGSAASSAAQSASGSSPGSSGAGSGEDSALFGALVGSASHVQGAWGSGRLLHSSLLSVLITNNGRILAGAVTPSVLYADAARVK